MNPLRFPILIAFLAGLLSATGFAPLDLWPVTLLAVAMLIHLVRGASGIGRALLIGWVFGLGNFVVGLNWIATAFTYQAAMPAWLGWVAVLLLSLYLAVYPAIACGLAWRFGRGRALDFALLFAANWMLGEWLRATIFTGFAWNPLGVILVDVAAGQYGSWIGTYGLGGVVILTGAAVLALLELRRWRKALVVPFLLLFALDLRVAHPDTASGRHIRIVQANIAQQDKWREGFETINFERLARLTGRPGGAPRLILWPEVAVPDYLEEEPEARRRIAALIGPGDVLLTGGIAVAYDAQGNAVAARNSLFALDAGGRILARADKSHLVPYGEYLPMRPLLSMIGLSRLAPGDIDFLAGPGPQTIALPGFGRAGIQICYEIIFSGHVVDRADRPDFLFNPSNDAWFGAWGPPQHLAQARLRAMEEGLPVIRATPTGISAVVDADGRLIESLPWRREGVIETRLPRPGPPTPFARLGNLLPALFGLGLIAVTIAMRFRRR